MNKFLLIAGFLALGQYAQAQEPAENLDRNKRWTLQELVDYANQNNLQVRQSELDLLSSEVELKRSKMDLLPSLNGNASYSYSVGRSINPFTNIIEDQPISSQNYSLNSGFTLFNGFALRNTIKQNQLNLNAANFTLADIRNDISLNVATAYLNILLNQELLNNAEARLVVSKNQLDRTEKLIKAGSQPETARFEFNAQVANDMLAVTNANNNLEIARLSLKQLLQIPAEEPLLVYIPELDIQEATPYPTSSNAVYEQALTNQPDIQAANLQVQSSELGVAVAKGRLLPTLSINGGVSTAYSSLAPDVLPAENAETISMQVPIGYYLDGAGNPVEVVTDRDIPLEFEENTYINQLDYNLRRFVQVNMNIPIFNGYRARSNVAQARISADRAQLQVKQVRQQLRQNIEQAALDVQAAALSYRASEQQVLSLREALKATNIRLDAGAASPLDYSLAKANLDAAEANFIRSKYDYIFKTKVLDFYSGQPLSLK